jgi:hypothetical protein
VSTQPSASSTQPAASHSPMPWRPIPSTPSPVRFEANHWRTGCRSPPATSPPSSATACRE